MSLSAPILCVTPWIDRQIAHAIGVDGSCKSNGADFIDPKLSFILLHMD